MARRQLNEPTRRCQALTKAGKPCRAAATEGGLCFFHANPSKAVELGRIGGLKNRHPIIERRDGDPSPWQRHILRSERRRIDDMESHPGAAAYHRGDTWQIASAVRGRSW
jgi:Family of unknown function (DUF5763)